VPGRTDGGGAAHRGEPEGAAVVHPEPRRRRRRRRRRAQALLPAEPLRLGVGGGAGREDGGAHRGQHARRGAAGHVRAEARAGAGGEGAAEAEGAVGEEEVGERAVGERRAARREDLRGARGVGGCARWVGGRGRRGEGYPDLFDFLNNYLIYLIYLILK